MATAESPSARVEFRVGMPLERALATARGTRVRPDHAEVLGALAARAAEVWAPYERRILGWFETMYQARIAEPVIPTYVSLLIPNPISEPVVLRLDPAETLSDPDAQRDLVYQQIHQLAHYLLPLGRAQAVVDHVAQVCPDNRPDASIHVVIHAVELGMGGELFGAAVAARDRERLLTHRVEDYRISARQLIERDIPLDATALDAVARLD
jgi:hypothetical protein